MERGQGAGEAAGEQTQRRFGQRPVPVDRLPERQPCGEPGRQPGGRCDGVGVHQRYEEVAGQRARRRDGGSEPVPDPRDRGVPGFDDPDGDEAAVVGAGREEFAAADRALSCEQGVRPGAVGVLCSGTVHRQPLT
ncbi:hypothetical protein ACFV2A_21880 [Streptomyces californicus]|uniref:hypothetical protein n=1 Tax=Streptomyces californicus TaxID=67351 RepID=UPI00368FFB1B